MSHLMKKEELEKMYLQSAIDGDLEKIKEAIKMGVNINACDNKRRGYSALHLAVENDHQEVIKFLISKGINKETKLIGEPPFIVRLRPLTGLTPLMYAMLFSKIETIKTLVDNGCNLKATSNEGITALMIATNNYNNEIVEYLLSLPDMDINQKDPKGETALSYAARHGRLETFLTLINYGAVFDLKTNNGKSIQETIETDKFNLMGKFDILPFLKMMEKAFSLAESGPESFKKVFEDKFNKKEFIDFFSRITNARRSKDGNTLLHVIAKKNWEYGIIKLLELGADPYLLNKEGITPVSMLKNHKHPYVRAMLSLAELKAKAEDISKKTEIKERETKQKEVKEPKPSKEIEEVMKSLMQIMKALSPIELHYINLKLFQIISQPHSILYNKDQAHSILQKLLNEVDHLKNDDQEKTVFDLLRILSNKNSPFYDEKLIKNIFTKMKLEFVADRADAEALLNNDFKNEHVVFTLKNTKDKVPIFQCLIRIPPKTFDYDISLSINGYNWISKELGLSLSNLNLMTFSTLSSLQSHFITSSRQDLALKRSLFLEDERTRDLKRTAQQRESSIREFSSNQIGILDAIRNKYKDKFKKMGEVEGVIKNYREYLEKEYNKNPPQYKGQKLPLRYEPKLFERHGQSLEEHLNDKRSISELYYMNPIHTAWRYFLNPNPWIDPNAQYAVIEEGVATHAAMTESAREDLAYLWLAASDTSITPIRDMTVPDMMRLFTEEIANINRGHNWDELDSIKEGPEKRKIIEEMIKKYGKTMDDRKPDNPSCYVGVNQRLMQSVLGNPITETPETRFLDPSIARQYVIDLITMRFNEYLSKKEYAVLKKLRDIINKKYVEMETLSKPEEALFNEFRLSREDATRILKEMHELFGERMSFVEIQVTGEGHYTCYEEYVRKLLSQNLYETFYERMSSILDNNIKVKETKHEKEGKEHKKEVAHKKEAAHPQPSVRALVSHWEIKGKDKEREIKEREIKERKGRVPKSPKGGGGAI